MVTKITKTVPKTVYVIDGVEFDGTQLFETLNNIANSSCWVDACCLPDECPHELAKLSYVEEKLFHYEDVYYRDTVDKKAGNLLREILNISGSTKVETDSQTCPEQQFACTCGDHAFVPVGNDAQWCKYCGLLVDEQGTIYTPEQARFLWH